MKSFKNVTFLGLAMLMTLGVCAGCSSKGSVDDPGSISSSSSASAEASPSQSLSVDATTPAPAESESAQVEETVSALDVDSSPENSEREADPAAVAEATSKGQLKDHLPELEAVVMNAANGPWTDTKESSIYQSFLSYNISLDDSVRVLYGSGPDVYAAAVREDTPFVARVEGNSIIVEGPVKISRASVFNNNTVEEAGQTAYSSAVTGANKGSDSLTHTVVWIIDLSEDGTSGTARVNVIQR